MLDKMEDYNQKDIRKKIKKILDSPYESMHPYEIEKELGVLFKIAEQNKDVEIKKEILREIDLINRIAGWGGIYQGKKVEEISNKWRYILDTMSFKPFSNPPFCEWKKEAVDYYKERYAQAESNLAKARYSFTIMVFSSGHERLEWMKKSIDNWLKTAEKYISEGVYNKKYYEVPPFAYEFSLRLSMSFSQKDLTKEILNSLHKNIIKILNSGENRWYLEYLEVEVKYINQINGFEKEKNESIEKIKERIKKLENEISSKKNPPFHFLRNHINFLISYGIEDLFYWNKKIADSYITEAETRDEPLVKSSFLSSSIKHYKLMQGKSPNSIQKKEIDKKIDGLTLKIKEISKKIKYKEFGSVVTIKKEDIKKIIKGLGENNIFYNLLSGNSFIPNYQQTIKSTEEIKKKYPLGFIIPNTISKEDSPIITHISEKQIFDFRVRQNILIGIKMGSIMVKMALEEIKKECKIDYIKEAKKLISETSEIEDIKEIIDRGINYILGEPKDFIAGVHIITPYFEEIIRRILVKIGEKDLVLGEKKEKYFKKILLGSLLESDSVKKTIGEDFQQTLKVLLADNDQVNLRHDLTHGLLTTKRINEEETIYVAYCLLKLIKILKEI